MSPFDSVFVIDWSAASTPAPRRPSPNAIWIGIADAQGETALYMRTRDAAMAFLEPEIAARLEAGERVLCGFDFPFGYPKGTTRRITGSDDPFALWTYLADRIGDGPENANNRFEVADDMNARQPGIGPFWGRPDRRALDHLPTHGRTRAGHGFPERRACERLAPGASTVWQLLGNGSVGSQALTGIPRLARMRERFGRDCAFWPFERPDAPLVLAEVYPSLLAASVRAVRAHDPNAITDKVQVRLLSRALRGMSWDGTLAEAFNVPEIGRDEAWILGLGYEDALARHARNGMDRK